MVLKCFKLPQCAGSLVGRWRRARVLGRAEHPGDGCLPGSHARGCDACGRQRENVGGVCACAGAAHRGDSRHSFSWIAVDITWLTRRPLPQGESLPPLAYCEVRRWGAGFFEKPLGLSRAGDSHNDAVTFAPWRLVHLHEPSINEPTSARPVLYGEAGQPRHWYKCNLAQALAGDYFGERQDIETAVLSGMMAANRVVGWSPPGSG